jgi:glycosyltransferase involved in cell wall biosynthesis
MTRGYHTIEEGVMKTLVIIPAFNEQENIGKLLEELIYLNNIAFDIIVINDHSSDNTLNICKNYDVNFIDLPCNLGIGGAVQTGYKYAYKYGYDIAVQVDGDGQHRPEFLELLLRPLIEDEADMSIGSRYIEKKGFQSTILRRIGINYFSKMIYLCTKKIISDPTSGFRACNSKVIKIFSEQYPTDYPEPESIVYLLRNNYRIKEIPVIMQERMAGTSSIKTARSIYYMIKVSLAILIDIMRKEPLNKYEVQRSDSV